MLFCKKQNCRKFRSGDRRGHHTENCRLIHSFIGKKTIFLKSLKINAENIQKKLLNSIQRIPLCLFNIIKTKNDIAKPTRCTKMRNK